MSNSCDDVIDLTDSFILADHCGLSNVIIDLEKDDSIIEVSTLLQSNSTSSSATSNFHDKSYETRSSVLKKKHLKQSSIKNNKIRSSKFGECPICWDKLGKNPLASTKCGHVYCLHCIEHSLRLDKKCPSCRHVLKGHSAYHPLYLSGD